MENNFDVSQMSLTQSIDNCAMPALKKSMIPGYKLKTHRLSHVSPFLSPRHLQGAVEENQYKLKR